MHFSPSLKFAFFVQSKICTDMFVLLFKNDEKFPTDDGTMGGGGGKKGGEIFSFFLKKKKNIPTGGGGGGAGGGDKTGTTIFLFTVHTCTMNGTLGHKYL